MARRDHITKSSINGPQFRAGSRVKTIQLRHAVRIGSVGIVQARRLNKATWQYLVRFSGDPNIYTFNQEELS